MARSKARTKSSARSRAAGKNKISKTRSSKRGRVPGRERRALDRFSPFGFGVPAFYANSILDQAEDVLPAGILKTPPVRGSPWSSPSSSRRSSTSSSSTQQGGKPTQEHVDLALRLVASEVSEVFEYLVNNGDVVSQDTMRDYLAEYLPDHLIGNAGPSELTSLITSSIPRLIRYLTARGELPQHASTLIEALQVTQACDARTVVDIVRSALDNEEIPLVIDPNHQPHVERWTKDFRDYYLSCHQGFQSTWGWDETHVQSVLAGDLAAYGAPFIAPQCKMEDLIADEVEQSLVREVVGEQGLYPTATGGRRKVKSRRRFW
jgi:hypothetical protein